MTTKSKLREIVRAVRASYEAEEDEDRHPLLKWMGSVGIKESDGLKALYAWERPHETAHRVLLKAYEMSETWEEDNLGTNLAYLMMAILQPDGEGKFELENEPTFMEFMRQNFLDHDPVWQWIAEPSSADLEEEIRKYLLSEVPRRIAKQHET